MKSPDLFAVQDTESASLSATLQQSLLPSLILEALPKSQIDLFLTILESDGSDADISACVTDLLRSQRASELKLTLSRSSLCSGVTAASVALAEAGVQMYGLVVGCCAVSAAVPLLIGPSRAHSPSRCRLSSRRRPCPSSTLQEPNPRLPPLSPVSLACQHSALLPTWASVESFRWRRWTR